MADPILEACWLTYPERPVIDVATTPYTRDRLADRIDYWMGRLDNLLGESE